MNYGLRQERLKLAMRQLMGDKTNCGIYLYGAGARGRASFRNLVRIGLSDNVLAYVDDAQKYRGGGTEGERQASSLH